MSDKTIVFTPEAGGAGGNGMMAMLAPLLQQKGIDPNLLVAMQGKNGNNGFGGDGSWLWLILIFFLFPMFSRGGWGGFGGGDNGNGGGFNASGIPNLINNDAGRELIMSAIQGNGAAINSLATNLNCSVGQVQQAINGLNTQLQQVGNQSNMNSMQVINAINAGNTTLGTQLAQCCCDNRLAICNQTNSLTTTMNSNTLALRDGASANTQAILAKLDAAEMREMQNRLDSERQKSAALANQLSQEHQNNYFAQVTAQSVAPINAALADFSNRLGKIECALPSTVSVPWPQLQAYDPSIARSAAIGAAYGDFAAQGLYGGNCGC